MPDAADPRLAAWANYYVIIGAAAASLIGIQFVVITVVASMRRSPTADTINAFSTPTIVHLASALLISAIMAAPWPSHYDPNIPLMLSGLGGLLYCAIIIGRVRRQNDYKPVWEDWCWYTILPSTAYATLALTLVWQRLMDRPTLFITSAATLGLLLISIHNAWDSVTHIVITEKPKDDSANN